MTTLTVNTEIEITERAFWHSTKPAPTVIATVTAVKPQRIGVRYVVKFELPKLLNGHPVQCHRVLSDSELAQCLVKVIKKTRKQQPRVVKRSGKVAA